MKRYKIAPKSSKHFPPHRHHHHYHKGLWNVLCLHFGSAPLLIPYTMKKKFVAFFSLPVMLTMSSAPTCSVHRQKKGHKKWERRKKFCLWTPSSCNNQKVSSSGLRVAGRDFVTDSGVVTNIQIQTDNVKTIGL